MRNLFLKTVFLSYFFIYILLFYPNQSLCQKSQSPNKPNLTIANFPRIDGSTSTHPLEIIIASKLLGLSYQWPTTTYNFNLEKHPYPVTSDTTLLYITNNISRKIVSTGTHYAYENLILGISDLIFEARPPSPDELDLAKKCNIKLISKPVALDAFVFLLNKNNLVQNLTIQQIQDIYSGKITQWEQVGGTTAKINAYQREDNSGSQELMKSLVMKDLPIISAPHLRSAILYSMMGPINQISQDTYGLSYSVYYYEEYMAPNDKIKLCPINGVIPNNATIKSKKYPLTTEVYAVTRENIDKKSTTYQLWQWLSSKEGKSVIKESGYISID